MTWLRIDDGFPQHPKVVQLARSERWTWLEILAYCARYRTCGKVPSGVREAVGDATPKLLAKLVTIRLLDVEDDGWKVHDWDEYNPKDPSAAERAKRYRDRNAHRDGQRDDDRDESRDEIVTVTAPRARASAPVPVPSPSFKSVTQTTAVANGAAPAAHEATIQLQRLGFDAKQIVSYLEKLPADQILGWIAASESPGIRNPGAWLNTRLSEGSPPPGHEADPVDRYISLHGYPTGYRFTRGLAAGMHIRDPLGFDTPPPDAPSAKPTRKEIADALAAKEGAAT